MKKDTILVTWDFTEVNENALLHAIKLSNYLENKIQLIHIVKNGKLKKEAERKLENDTERLSAKHQVKLEPVIREGSLFQEISNYASNHNISLVVMGTHGIKGVQKLTGSWALKVIVGSRVPFVVVQGPPSKKEIFRDIVFPLDYKKETKQKVNWAIFLAKYFDVKIHIITPKKIRDSSLQKKTKVNVNFAEKIFKNHNIKYDVHNIDSNNLGEETVDYAIKIDADMILIMTTKDIAFTDYLLGAKEQYIIANQAQIPVMCANPRTDLSRYGSFSSTGG
ncbi:MAG: universal stress protein [Bacteroidales bacterium]